MRADHHVHSTYSSDAVSTLEQNVAVAGDRGLTTLCLADHVRADTTWVPEFVVAVKAARAGTELEVLCGVEAKILDDRGRVDVPADLPAVDRVLIADHQFPGVDGPVAPNDVRRRLNAEETTPEEVVQTLVDATVAALRRTPTPQLAHLFSILPKVGLNESDVEPDHLRLLATTARATGALVEVNEKWNCPGPAAVAAFRAEGVPVVPSTDSHDAQDVGRYRRVLALLARAGPG